MRKSNVELTSGGFWCAVSYKLLQLSGISVILATSQWAHAAQSLGTGDASLLGGDLTDPTDTVALSADPAQALPESDMIPTNATWVKMTCYPVTGPYAIPYQRHPYQSLAKTPPCALVMNKPAEMKWYIDFKDGGFGGPSSDDPYFVAIELKDAFVLTHFTVTPNQDSPEQDPKQWAIQGSNTGLDDDWTDIYVCSATNRNGTVFQEGSRNETFLFTTFNSAGMAKSVTPEDAKKLRARLKHKRIKKADFARPAGTYTWFRIVIYSCFNRPFPPGWIYKNASGGLSLGQVEFFGVKGEKEKVAPKAVKAEEPVTPPPLDAPFIISYWCGPSQADTTLERIKEIAECGFTVAQAPDLWEPPSEGQVKFNLKFLDYCQEAGIKAFIFDGNVWKDGEWSMTNYADFPKIEKTLDVMIANYSKHPALMGFVLGDEMGYGAHPRLKFLTHYLLKNDPSHLPYYNNLPSYAAGNPRSYEREVAAYLKTVKPALFSWDAYWQMSRGDDENYYWDNLEMVRRQCLKSKTPFNQIIVSLKHMGYRECREADLRWQVWTSLAYGSRGIQYFTYCHVPVMAEGDAPGLLTKDFKRDVKWFQVQKLNHNIAKLGTTLVKLTSTGVYNTEPLPIGTVPLLPEAPVKMIEGGSMVVGCFTNAAGLVYVLPVNRSRMDRRTFFLKVYEKAVSTSEVSQKTGELLPSEPLKDKVLEVKLEAGEGRLFLLNNT
ncbi:MAG: hypothetical protein WCP86_05270 [bacterium]